jgi:hypothetical protein
VQKREAQPNVVELHDLAHARSLSYLDKIGRKPEQLPVPFE